MDPLLTLWTPYGPLMNPLWTPYEPPMDPLWPLWTPFGTPKDPLWTPMDPPWPSYGRKLNIGLAKKRQNVKGAASGAPSSKESQSAYTTLHQLIAHKGSLYLEQRQSWHPQPSSLLQSSPHHRVEHIFFHRQSDRLESTPSGAHT
jgi:hypothetical protein